MNIVITGTAQGIGFELTKLGLSKGHHVLAIARSRDNSHGLENIKDDRLSVMYLDLSETGATEKVVAEAQRFPSVDLLINNAGVYRKGEDAADFEESFLVNTIAPFLLTKGLLPLLKKSKTPKAAHISSVMGSIADNSSGGAHAYRSSKAALNMLMKGLSIDEKWLASLCLHPGWVQTRMGTDAAPVKPADSARGIWQVIEEFSLKESGSFLDYQGQKLPW